jgi:hypothetical protein
LFIGRQWPVGYEFPACNRFNDEGRLREMTISTLYRISLRPDREDPDFERALQGIRNNRPKVMDEWLSMTRREERNGFRDGFGVLGDRFRRAGYGLIALGPHTKDDLQYFGQKLGKALFYKHCGKILDNRLVALPVSMVKARDSIDELLRFAPATSETVRANVDLSDQFSYRYNYHPDYGLFFAVVRFQEQLGYKILAMSKAAFSGLRASVPHRAQEIDALEARCRSEV